LDCDSDANFALAAKNLANPLAELMNLSAAIGPKLGDSKQLEFLNGIVDSSMACSKLVVQAKQATKDPLVKKSMAVVQKDLSQQLQLGERSKSTTDSHRQFIES